ncbi:LexA/Signal peptidase [Schizophyllum commune H4-8]|uniref:LexA/Signal peptidase n=1 Tax=Schizophyllum commune (strain H4-8 / FGSC 9210) TaxID=578458 RepID=UPI00215DE25A|nr:LexA/Signal peptidase [Schizophyllum commune H4-8]KAI5898728.1 LexA/Signal peptidase [Schizophyllum commune H4-8]
MAGPSMLPTFDHTGEVVIESRLGAPYDRRTLARGELVSFYSPLDPMRLVCKRVLGLPGDVVCVDPSGKYAPSDEHVVVPEGHVWLAGDNLAWSRDSRVYGPVPMSLIAGKIKARVSGVRCYNEGRADSNMSTQIWPLFKPIPEWPTGRTT